MQCVNLAQLGDGALVTRSQARRVAQRFHEPAVVELDFAGITEIGQAFADKMFRVFAVAHAQVRITPLNTAPAVAQSIKRVVAARAAQAPQGGGGTTE
jgi:hypothetical protein